MAADSVGFENYRLPPVDFTPGREAPDRSLYDKERLLCQRPEAAGPSRKTGIARRIPGELPPVDSLLAWSRCLDRAFARPFSYTLEPVFGVHPAARSGSRKL